MKKRADRLEVERDLDLMLTLRLEGVLTKRQIYDEVNRVREEIAYRRARALGASEEEAERAGREARVSAQQLRADYRDAVARIEAQTDEKSRLLMFRRLKEVETEMAAIRAMEERAWNELNRSGREALVKRTDRQEARQRRGADGQPAQGFDAVPRDGTQTREELRSADPRWMERIESLLWKRWQMSFEAFRLRTLLGMEVPPELAALAKSGSPDAAEKLRAHEAGLLYSMEARAAGLTAAGESRSRLQMISAFLAKRGGAGGEGGTTRVQFEVIGLEVDGAGEP
jgi:hypothetical protein